MRQFAHVVDYMYSFIYCMNKGKKEFVLFGWLCTRQELHSQSQMLYNLKKIIVYVKVPFLTFNKFLFPKINMYRSIVLHF